MSILDEIVSKKQPTRSGYAVEVLANEMQRCRGIRDTAYARDVEYSSVPHGSHAYAYDVMVSGWHSCMREFQRFRESKGCPEVI